MVNKPKRIDTDAETAVVRYAEQHGFPLAERRALAGADDGPMVTRPESEGSDPWAQSGESLLDQGAGS